MADPRASYRFLGFEGALSGRHGRQLFRSAAPSADRPRRSSSPRYRHAAHAGRAIFARARNEARVILTFDLDFARLVFDAGASLPSTVIIRLTNPRADQEIGRLMAALGVASSALETGAVVVVDDTRVRVRELPIG